MNSSMNQLKSSLKSQTASIKNDIDESVNFVDPSFKPIAKYLLSTDTKRHNRYCPCCRTIDENESPMQMAEFMEFIKGVHSKLTGSRLGRKERPKD